MAIVAGRSTQPLERMSRVKRLLISTAIALVLVLVIGVLFAVFPQGMLGNIIFAVGMPLVEVLARLIPDACTYEIVPSGGASAAAVLFAISALISWFVIFELVAFAVISRVAKNEQRL